MKQIPLCYVKGKHSPQTHGLAKGSVPSDQKEGPTLKAQHGARGGCVGGYSFLPSCPELRLSLCAGDMTFTVELGGLGFEWSLPGEKGGGWQELSTADS